MPISAQLVSSLNISTMTGADGKLYIFRVRDMKTYLAAALGVTPQKVTKDFSASFIGSRGLVSFDIAGWSDASGHVALWDGNAFKETHDDYRNQKDDPSTPVVEATTQAMTLWAI